MQKSKEQEFRQIEKNIDSYIAKHKFLSLEKDFAILSLLSQYELTRRGDKMFPSPSRKYSEIPIGIRTLFSRALERALFFIFENCVENKFEVEDHPYQKLWSMHTELLKEREFFVEMFGYVEFEYACKMFSRGFFDVSIEDNHIKFLPKNTDYFSALMFEETKINELRKKSSFLHSSKKLVNLDLIQPNTIKNISKTLHYWLHKTNFLPSSFNIPKSIIIFLVTGELGKIESFKEITINWDFGEYNLEDFRKFWSYVAIKCSLIEYYLDPLYYSVSIQYPLFFIQTLDEWTKEISQGANLNVSIAKSLIRDLTFNSNLKTCGVRIQPFIPLNEKYLALVPSLATVYSTEDYFLELQCKINKNQYDSLSSQKELILIEDISSILIKRNDLIFENRIKIKKDQRILTDIDIAIYEKSTNSLILAQIKWPRRVKSVLDSFAKDEEIEQGITQAEVSYNYVKSNLEIFMHSYFRDLPLAKINNIYSCVISRNNIGSSSKHSTEFPVIDYEIFKMYLTHYQIPIGDMFSKFSKRDYLPKLGIDFKLEFIDLTLGDYKYSIPGATPILDKMEKTPHFSEDFKIYLENLSISNDYSLSHMEKKGYSVEKIADAKKRFLIGMDCLKTGDIDQAIDALSESAEILPQWRCYSNLGGAYIIKGNFDLAEKALLQADNLNPESTEVQKNLANLYCIFGDEVTGLLQRLKYYNKAKDSISYCLDEDPFDFHSLYLLGYIYDRIGEPNKAVYYYRKSTILCPDFIEPHEKLFALYFKLEKYLDSLRHLEETARIKPDDPEIYFLLSGMYINLGIFNTKSLEIIRKALQRKPNSEGLYVYLLSTLAELGNDFQQEYLENLLIFIKKFPYSNNIDNARKELEKLMDKLKFR